MHKKILVLILITLALLSVVIAVSLDQPKTATSSQLKEPSKMTVTLDSYATSNYDDMINISGSSATIGQSFTTPNDGVHYDLTSATFYLFKTGSPVALFVAKLYAHTGTYGAAGSGLTGSALATSGTYQVSALTGSPQLIEFDFTGANAISLNPNTHYVINLEVSSYTTLNGSNFVECCMDSSSPTAAGALMYNGNYFQPWDLIFYVAGSLPGDNWTISSSADGSCSPTGLQVITTNTDVTATASDGYLFGYWLLDAANIGGTPTYTMVYVGGATHTLEAVFIQQVNSSVSGSASTFGHTTAPIGASAYAETADALQGIYASLPVSGYAYAINASLRAASGFSTVAKAALYNSSSGLVAQTAQLNVAIQSTASWFTFIFASPVSLSAGNYYIVVYVKEVGSNVWYVGQSTGSGLNYQEGVTYPTFPSTASFTPYATVPSIYCIYGASATAPLIIEANFGGSTNPIPGFYTSSPQTVTATGSVGNSFSYWMLNGVYGGTTNPLTVTWSTYQDLIPVFNQTSYVLKTRTTSGGAVLPLGDTAGYSLAGTDTATVTAYPNAGKQLQYWLVTDNQNTSKGDTRLYPDNPVTITMDDNRCLIPFFIATDSATPVKIKTDDVTRYYGSYVSTSTVGLASSQNFVSKVTIPVNTLLYGLRVNLLVSGATVYAKAVIYTDNAGSPGNAVAVGLERKLAENDYNSYYLLPFDSSINVAAGTYWIGLIPYYTSGSVSIGATATATALTAYSGDSYILGPESTFSVTATYTALLAIRAESRVSQKIVYPPAINSNKVVTLHQTLGIRFQPKTFWAAGRIWLFYIDVVGGVNNAYVTSSLDGVTWASPTLLMTTGGEYEGENLEALLGTNGLIHVIVRDGTLFYRAGTPNSNGTITWVAAWDNFWAPGGSNTDFYMSLDNQNFPYVSWGLNTGTGGNIQQYVSKSSTNSGTWTTAAGYPVALTAVGYEYSNSFLVPLSNSKMYLFYFDATAEGYSTVKPVYGILYNGVSWGTPETITSTYGVLQEYSLKAESWSRGALSDSVDNIHFVFYESQHRVIYMKRDANLGWQTPVVIDSNLDLDASPGITLDQNDALRLFWVKNNLVLTTAIDVDGKPSSNSIIIANLNTVTAYADPTYYSSHDGVINPFPQVINGQLGFMFIQQSTTNSTFDLEFGLISSFYSYTVDEKIFNDIKAGISRGFGINDFGVTLQTLTLGAQDATTGWYLPIYVETNIEMVIQPKGAVRQNLITGFMPSLDAIGFTISAVTVASFVTDYMKKTYRVETVTPWLIGDKLKFYTCDLKEMVFYG